MTTLFQHVENLKRFTDDTEEEIMCSILHSNFVMDDNSLLSFSIEKNIFGTWMSGLWMDGDGHTIYRWIKEAKEKYKVDKIYFVSNRWKAMDRKYKELKIKPIGVLCEVGGDFKDGK